MNNNTNNNGIVEWQSPSNIAIVKYWGKRDLQIPMNPSLSFSLKNSFSSTRVEYKKVATQKHPSFNFFLDDKSTPTFETKLKSYFSIIIHQFSWLVDYQLNIYSSNTFPHSAGIASSASAFSALAFCLAQIHQQLGQTTLTRSEISELARMGSGSAARSVFGGWNLWGKSETFNQSTNHYAVNISSLAHPIFNNYRDTILLVSNDKKPISSSAGHSLMNHHPYKKARLDQAHQNISKVTKALKEGDLNTFIAVTEEEALSLHGLMMSSKPGYTLLHPNSLTLINKVRSFREKTGLPLGFTFDAGPNMHLLFPKNIEEEVNNLVKNELSRYCQNKAYLNDSIGDGPKQIS